MGLMTKQVDEQDTKQSSIEETLDEQITNQTKQINEQCDVYKKQTEVKQDEEKEHRPKKRHVLSPGHIKVMIKSILCVYLMFVVLPRTLSRPSSRKETITKGFSC